MSYCLNPDCQNPQNHNGTGFCQSCGAKLLLKDRYQVIQLLGQGATGRTFLAVDEDQPSQPRCVIKQFFGENITDAAVSSPSAQGIKHRHSKTFSQTAKQLDELGKHPLIPELWASFEQDGHQYLVKKYIEGENLALEVAETGTFSEPQIRELLKDVLPVLSFAHNHHIVHGDIKPENIIRRPDGKLILVDYGDVTQTGTSLPAQKRVSGSAEYIAPEQTQGKATPSSDLYSLGVTCIHLLTQLSPFDLFDIKTETWVWRDYLSAPVNPHLGAILDKLLERSPKKRYQSAALVLKDLNSWALVSPASPQKARLAAGAIGGAAIAILMATLSAREPAPMPHSAYNPQEMPITLPDLSYSAPRLDSNIQPLRTFAVDSGPFWSVAVSGDGQTVATGSYDGTVQLWDLGTGQLKTILAGHFGAVWTVAISPDGQTLATGSEDKTIKIWDLRTGELRDTLNGHSEAIFSLAFSPDGQTLASASEDKTIKLWNWRAGNQQRTLRGHSEEVQSVAFSPDGQTLASGSSDDTVKLWNWRTGQLRHTLKGHSDAVWSVAISPDGETLATGSWDNTIKLWDLNTGLLVNTFIGHSDQIQSVAFSPDGRTLASGDMDGTIKLWQLGTGGLVGTLKGHSSWVKLAFSPQGQTLISGSFDDTIKMWSLCP